MLHFSEFARKSICIYDQSALRRKERFTALHHCIWDRESGGNRMRETSGKFFFMLSCCDAWRISKKAWRENVSQNMAKKFSRACKICGSEQSENCFIFLWFHFKFMNDENRDLIAMQRDFSAIDPIKLIFYGLSTPTRQLS